MKILVLLALLGMNLASAIGSYRDESWGFVAFNGFAAFVALLLIVWELDK